MKTKNIKILLVSAVALASFSSCDEMFEPALENNLGIDYMTKDASYAEGVLGNGYTRIPCRDFPFSEVATDDAVSNDAGNSYRRLTAGAWTSDNNPAERVSQPLFEQGRPSALGRRQDSLADVLQP